MPEIIKLIGEGKNLWVIAGCLLLPLCFNIKAIHSFFDTLSVRKLPVLKDFSGETGATGLTKEVLQEAVNSALFRYITGINAEEKLREKIIKLHQLADGRLTYRDIKRTLVFIEIKQNGQLCIRSLTLFDWIRFCINWLFSLIFAFTAIVFLLIPLLTPTELRFQVVAYLYSLVLFTFFLLILSQTTPIVLIKKVKLEVNKINKKSFENVSASQEREIEYSSSWLNHAAMFKDDPLFDEFVEDIKAYRNQLDIEVATNEVDSKENHIA